MKARVADDIVPPRLEGLQLGRALAASTVVVGHAVSHAYFNAVDPAWQLAARYGVTLFFVISGFIMVQTTGDGAFDVVRFISRRVRRVAPIYWFTTLLVAIVALLVPSLFNRTTFDLLHLFQSLLFLPAYDPSGSGHIYPLFRLGWTLNYEMFFYAAFAATFALRAWTRAIVLTVFFGTLIVLGFQYDFASPVLQFYTRIDTLAFIAGVWLGVFNSMAMINASRSVTPLLAVVSTAILLYIAIGYGTLRPNSWTQVWLVVACVFHIALLLLVIDRQRWHVPRALRYLGDASYSMYLFHMFAIGAVNALAHRLPDTLFPAMVVVSAASGIMAGVIGYELIEKPLNRLMRERRPLTAAQIPAGTEPLVIK
jgi:exopolysaccharide production protein ExoZ